MNKLDEEVLVQNICRHLDASIAHLPQSISQFLAMSRQAALLQNTHANSQDPEALENAVSKELNDNSALAPDIEARLGQIRHNAVAKFEQLQEKAAATTGFSFNAWIKTQFDAFNLSASAGMLATASIVVTAIAIFYVNSRPAGSLTLDEEISLVATVEDIELYENLEFYLWLAENESPTL
ncbi:MAG: hypothetical protein JKY40_07635 [Gammaproteobacteria bacterium]|nr:hypothetical protein [Gammaproteobacteria bacterium]